MTDMTDVAILAPHNNSGNVGHVGHSVIRSFGHSVIRSFEHQCAPADGATQEIAMNELPRPENYPDFADFEAVMFRHKHPAATMAVFGAVRRFHLAPKLGAFAFLLSAKGPSEFAKHDLLGGSYIAYKTRRELQRAGKRMIERFTAAGIAVRQYRRMKMPTMPPVKEFCESVVRTAKL
jgi:hypothetical protein